jgi:DNA-damage-inducible protein J
MPAFVPASTRTSRKRRPPCWRRWLTVSEAFRVLLTRVAREKALPFEPLVPNVTPIEAMKEARRGGLQSFATVEELRADLNADD